jgi:hypothetical protein
LLFLFVICYFFGILIHKYTQEFYVAAYDRSNKHNKYISVPSNKPGTHFFLFFNIYFYFYFYFLFVIFYGIIFGRFYFLIFIQGAETMRIKMAHIYNILYDLLTPDLVKVLWSAEVSQIQQTGSKVGVTLLV